MKIKKIWANNFRTIKGYQELPLNDTTTNLFVGETNGIGKSSWFFCFYYLVTGYINGKTQDEYVNWDSAEMSCGVEFEYKSHTFKIETSYKCGKDGKPGKADKTLWIDKEQYDGVTGCNKKLKEYFEPNLFLNATGLLQDSGNVVLIKDSERRDNLKKVFNLDYSDDIKELEKEEKSVDVNELNPKQKSLIELQAKTFDKQKLLELPSTENEYTTAKDNITTTTSDIAKIDLDIKSIDTKKKEKESKEAAIKSKQDLLVKENSSVERLNNEIESLEHFNQDFSRINKYKDDLEKIKFERVKQFDDSILNTKLQLLADNCAKIKSLQKTITDCKSGKCPTCGDDFNSTKHDAYETEIKAISDNNVALQNDIQNLKKEKSDYEEIVKQNESKKRDKELLESKIEAEQKRLDNELKVNADKLAQVKASLAEKESIVTNLSKEISDIAKALSEIVVDDISELLLKQHELQTKLSTNRTLVSNYESVISKNELIEKQNEKLESDEIENNKLIVETQKEADELIEKKQQLSKMRFFLKNEFPSYVISTMITSIQDTMNEFISKVYYKDLDIEISGTDDSIAILYGTGQRKVDVINASGAEKALLAISYCYALNKFKDYGVLFLDEVDESLKQDAAIKLAEAIKKIEVEYGFLGIVTHIAAVQDFYYANEANVIEVDK